VYVAQTKTVVAVLHPRDSSRNQFLRVPVSSEISDLCEISDLLLFFSYFASESKGIKFGNYFFDICWKN